jgi:glutaredoxin
MSYRVIGADWCPFCIKVKNYMQNKKIDFKWIDSDTPEGNQVRQEESKKHKFKTIPMVFKGDQFIGGCNEFFAKL